MNNDKNALHCSECGELFTRYTNEKTCSEECSKKREERINSREFKNNVGTEKTCVICGKAFRAKNKKREICSRECSAERARRNTRKALGIENYSICKNCGKEFEKKHKRVCCSEECRKEYRREYEKIKRRESRARARREREEREKEENSQGV